MKPTKQNQKENKSIRYVDMSIEELDNEIKEEKEWVNKLGHSKYDIEEIEKEKKSIAKQEEIIAQKKADYLESIKQNKQWWW